MTDFIPINLEIRPDSPAASYASESQQRLLKVLDALWGNEISGVSAAAIAKAINENASTVFRDLHNLKAAGYAEYVEDTKTWRISPRVFRRALTTMAEFDKAEKALAERKQRYGLTTYGGGG